MRTALWLTPVKRVLAMHEWLRFYFTNIQCSYREMKLQISEFVHKLALINGLNWQALPKVRKENITHVFVVWLSLGFH